MITSDTTILELIVNNHAGVMSHVTGLFSRRAFNLEGILCGPIGDGRQSVMYLLINRDQHVEQVIRQLEKLYDVATVTLREDFDRSVFTNLYQ